ncbi:MAG: glycosyltransferase family 4 protein [Actinobacteria bacterium]|nr:glycosyltransferase family 4 protein [Actinomycetota bacterium]
MRIALFTDTYLPEVNGAVTSIDSHTRLLGERGHEVLIICPRYRKPILYVVPHVTIQRYHSFSFISNKDTRIALPTMASVARKLRKFRPDVVHVHTPLSIGIIGLATARMMKLPIVETYHTYIPDFMQYLEPHRLLRLDDLQDRVRNSIIFERMFTSGTFHGLEALEEKGRRAAEEITSVAREALGALGGQTVERPADLTTRFAWEFTRTVYNRADLVITPSATLQRALVENGVTVPVEHLSNGIDLSLVKPKESYSPTGRLLHAGRLGFEKNIDIVVSAFAILLETQPQLTLDILGDGPACESLTRQAERLGISDRVRMRGFMDRRSLGKVYREYDAFVTASTIETQGIVLLEAMAAGLPIAGVRALAIPELVVDGRDGLLVEPGDERALAGVTERLVTDEALRARLGTAAMADVQPHSLPDVVTRLEGLYERVLASPRR